MVLQRLYPVWALIGPGLSDPGHIEIHSRTVYLDSEALLGSRAAIAAGALERRAILRCFGVALHETLHAKHTKRWAIEHDIALSESDDPADRQLAVDRRLLEEPRMEAHGVREFPPDSLRGRFVRRALQAAVADVILPAFTGQVLELAAAGQPLTRDLAARATVYLQARTHYGIVDPADLTGLGELWRAVLGEHDLRALDDLYARVVWIPDGELERLDEAAREYRRDRRRARPATERRRSRRAGGSGEGGGEADPGEGDGPDAGGRAGSGVARRRARAGDRDRPRRPARAARRGRRPRAGARATPPAKASERGEARPRARDRAADRAAARPRRRPAAVPRRGAARPPLRQPAAPGDHAGDAADRQAHPGRALRRPRVRTRPRRAGRRPAGHARIRGASPGRSRRRSRSRTSG